MNGCPRDRLAIGLLLKCCQDSVDDIEDVECKAMVRTYQQLAAEDIRFDVPLAEACAEDRQRFCSTVPPVSRV
jgi:Golgi apparatus protein 1